MSESVSYFRTIVGSALRVGVVFLGYQVYKFTDYGPGVPFYEYTNRLLNYEKYSREDIDEWIRENYNRETLLDPDFSRSRLYQLFLEEYHFNLPMVASASLLGILGGRKFWEMHMKRFIRGRKGYWTVKYWKRDGPAVKNGTHNQIYNYSQLPYEALWEKHGFLKQARFRVPMHIYLQELILDIRPLIDMDSKALIPDIMIQGELMVHITDPQKAAGILLDVDNPVDMGIKVEQFVRDTILQKIRENVTLVKYMHEDPDEYLKYLTKYLNQLLKQQSGLEVTSSEMYVSRQGEETQFDEDHDEEEPFEAGSPEREESSSSSSPPKDNL